MVSDRQRPRGSTARQSRKTAALEEWFAMNCLSYRLRQGGDGKCRLGFNCNNYSRKEFMIKPMFALLGVSRGELFLMLMLIFSFLLVFTAVVGGFAFAIARRRRTDNSAEPRAPIK